MDRKNRTTELKPRKSAVLAAAPQQFNVRIEKDGFRTRENAPMASDNYGYEGRLIGYARVSTSARSIEYQLDALTAAQCHTIYRDHGISGAKSIRPGLAEMLSDLREGDTVVVFKLDRLGRSVSHLSDLLNTFRADGIEFWSITEGIRTATSGGKLIFHLLSALAEYNRELITENTKAGLESAKARGKRLGRPSKLSLEDIELAALRIQNGETKSATSKRLGVSRATLDRGLQRISL